MTDKSQTTSPAVSKLLKGAEEIMVMARELQARGANVEALNCAMAANEYVRAARAMQDMEAASKAYEDAKNARL